MHQGYASQFLNASPLLRLHREMNHLNPTLPSPPCPPDIHIKVQSNDGTIYHAHLIPEDGNCLFAAVNRLRGTTADHTRWRHQVCRHISDNVLSYDIHDAMKDATFKRTMESEGKAPTITSYLQYMRQDGHFGTALELQAMADILCARFIIFTYDTTHPNQFIPVVQAFSEIIGTTSTDTAIYSTYHLLWKQTVNGIWHFEDVYPQPHITNTSDHSISSTTRYSPAHTINPAHPLPPIHQRQTLSVQPDPSNRCISITDFESIPHTPLININHFNVSPQSSTITPGTPNSTSPTPNISPA